MGDIIWFHKLIPIFLFINNSSKIKITYPRILFNLEKILIYIYDKSNIIKIKENYYPRWSIDHSYGKNPASPYLSSGVSETKIMSSEENNKNRIDPYMWNEGYRELYYNYGKLLKCENIDLLGFYEKNTENKKHYLTNKEKQLTKEIKFWLESKEWYEKTGLQWKRGSVLYGEPGTGKSCSIYNIARVLDLPIKIFHLENYTNQQLKDDWHDSTEGKIHLIEDFDTIFDKRKFIPKIETKVGLTFDGVLNIIDGVDQRNGIYTIITTNNINKLDNALLRPGRIDSIYEYEKVGKNAALFIAKNILFDFSDKEVENFVNKMCFPLSMAQIQEKCLKLAIENKWEKIETRRN